MSRSHRIGQTSEVKVYRLVTTRTYEATLFERASHKLGLDRAILGNMEDADAGLRAAAGGSRGGKAKAAAAPAGRDKMKVGGKRERESESARASV